jgi:PASTA domain
MSGSPLPPSARDPTAGETNPRREEVRALGLRGGPWRYLMLAFGIGAVIAGALWLAGRSTPPTMPDLTGRTFDEALGAISDTNDICLDIVRLSDTGEPGIVLEQQPVAGRDLTTRGATQWGVTLTVGTANRADIERAAKAADVGAICDGDRAGLFVASP